MNTPVEIDRDDLYDRFIRQQWTVVKLAEYYRCSIRTILRVLDRYEIPRPQPEQLPPIPADELRARYVERRETLRQVAEHYGCSITRVCSFLDRYQIPRRGQGWNSYSDWNDLSTSVV